MYVEPNLAILNPELTMTLPPYQTSSGCADIMMHTMERYFNQSENMDITDSIAEGLMKTVKKHAVILMTEPDNYESRAEVMWASSSFSLTVLLVVVLTVEIGQLIKWNTN